MRPEMKNETGFAIELQDLSKSFGGVNANVGISLQVKRGSIHAIIGENGAGKSTAMKMLFGIYRPDSGEIWVNGVKREWDSPRDAIRAGIGMVHQHFMLVEPESALENVLLEGVTSKSVWNWLPPVLRPMNKTSALTKLRDLSKRYQLEVDWTAAIEDLPVGVQQRIEILKLLYHEASILILDEPTAVLTPQETVQLFVNLKKLASEGKTILIITHKLKEVMNLADRVTVFRAGKVVGHREIAETSVEDLASLMVGRKVSLTVSLPPTREPGDPVLEFSNFSLSAPHFGLGSQLTEGERRHSLKNLNFKVRAGEVVGIAGVEGNGQSELLQVLLHPRDFIKRSHGDIKYQGRSALHWSSSEVRASGVGMVPEDRLREGLLLEEPLTESFLLGLQMRKPFNEKGFVDRKAVRERTEHAIREYDVRPADANAVAGRLSGGNQQKLIIAREFEAKPQFFVAAQPTRGVDVGAIEFIHTQILKARNSGVGVLVVSSELDEVLALSDRVLVLYEGQVVAEFERKVAPYDENKIGLSMGGSHS
jgi:general nucleoside transport system ATP-binding protein